MKLFWPVYVACLNIVDGVSTYYALGARFAREANPIMRYLYEISPTLFMVCKLVLGVAFPIILYMLAKHPSIKPQRAKMFGISMVFISLVYTFIIGMQFALWHAFTHGGLC